MPRPGLLVVAAGAVLVLAEVVLRCRVGRLVAMLFVRLRAVLGEALTVPTVTARATGSAVAPW